MENRFTGSAGGNRANWQRKPRENQVTNNSSTPDVEPGHDHRVETGASNAPLRRSFFYYNSNSKVYHKKYQHNSRKYGPQRRPFEQNFGPPRQSPAPSVEHQLTRGDTATRHDNVTEIHANVVAKSPTSVSQPEAAAMIVKGPKDKTRAQRKKAKREMSREERESKKQKKIKAFNEFKEKYSYIPEAERPFSVLPNGIVLAEPPILNTTDMGIIGAKPDVSKLQFVALDCETVMGYVEPPKYKSTNILGRVSIVDENLECIYDKFVKARTKIWAYNTPVSGIREEDMLNGEDFFTVQREVAHILYGKMLVGHSLNSDLSVLFLRHHNVFRRDTAGYLPLRKYNNGKTPSLKTLAKNLLGVDIQKGEHDSTIDARTSMQLYQLLAKEWEASLGNHKEIDTKWKILMSDKVWLQKSSYSRAECAHYKRLAQEQLEGTSDDNKPTTNGTETVTKETKPKLRHRQRNKMNKNNMKKLTEEITRNGNVSNNSYLTGATVNGNNSVIDENGYNDTKKVETSKVIIVTDAARLTASTEDRLSTDVELVNDLEKANYYLKSALKHMENVQSHYQLNKKTYIEKGIATLNKNVCDLTNQMKQLGYSV